MKLKHFLTLASLVIGGGSLWAQTADQYFPSVVMTNYADVLSDATTADPSSFNPLTGDYTLEVTGTSETEIKFPYDRYRSVSYTPTASGTIRFVHTGGKVYVYEKAATEFVYKGKATISSVTWPAMETDNVSDPTNLLGNPDFQTYGDKIQDGRWKLGTPWQISDASLYGGFRQGKNSNSHDNSGTTTDCFIWRTDNSNTGYKDKYFYQEVTLSPNSKYKYRIRTSQNTNGIGKYSIRLGSTPGGNEYSSIDFTIAKEATNNVASGDLTTGSTIGEHSYFSVYNAYDYNKTNNNACTQIDLIQLVEATTAATTITGVSDAKYKAAAVSPFCEGNMTAKISNPFIESGTSGWTNGRTNNGQQYTGAPGGTYMDTYNDTRDQYQSLASLPAGIYTLKAATRAEASLGVGYIYAQSGDIRIATTEVHKDGNTGGALGNGWGWTETTFVIAEEGSVRIGFYAECGGSKWAGADEFYLTYKGTELPSPMCTALLSEVVDGKMKADVASAQSTAKTNLESEVNLANYCALRNAIIAAKASKAAYEKGKAAIDKANDIMSKTNVYTAEAYATFSEAVATAESKYADGSWADNEATTFATSTLGNGWRSNASVDDFLISTWDVAPRTWNSYHVNTWSTTGDSGNPNLVVPVIEYWGDNASGLADKVMTATVAVEPYETYKVAAHITMGKNTTAYGEDAETAPVGVTLQVGEGTATTCTGTRVAETRFFEGTFEATGEADASGNLTIKIAAASTNASWIMFRDVKYTKQAAAEATAEEKAALLAAINTAKNNTLGFEKDEYAPYENIDALTKLAAAENAYANSTTKPAINGTKDALENAVWTSNAEEVNAFYDGTFSTREVQETSMDGTKIPGWTSGNNIRQILKTEANFPGLRDAINKTALFAWSGGASYGNDEGYTMPLKANSIYKLSLKVAGWNNETRGDITVSVKKSEDGMAATVIGKADKDISTGMTSFEILFVTGAAGNYVFSISSPNNIVFSDVELKKAASQMLTLPSATKYAAGTYPTVTLNRTFSSEKWNTLCVPFTFAKSNFAAVKVLSSVAQSADDVNMTFADADETVAAGTPCLVKATNNGDGLTVANVALDPSTTAQTKTVGDALKVNYIGTFTQVDLTDANSNAWVVSNNNLYNVDSDVTVGAYRAYFTVETSGAVKALNFSFDAVDAIEAIDNGQLTLDNAEIYNLAGQRVNKAQRGIYIVNGKKVLVK